MENGLNLGRAYGETLGRIKKQDWEKARLGMAAPMRISHSRRRLKVDEISQAIEVRIGHIITVTMISLLCRPS